MSTGPECPVCKSYIKDGGRPCAHHTCCWTCPPTVWRTSSAACPDRARLNCALPRRARFTRPSDRKLGVLAAAVGKRRVGRLSGPMRAFLATLPPWDVTVGEMAAALPEVADVPRTDTSRGDARGRAVPRAAGRRRHTDLRGQARTGHVRAAGRGDAFCDGIVSTAYMFSRACDVEKMLRHVPFTRARLEELYVAAVERMSTEAALLYDAALKKQQST